MKKFLVLSCFFVLLSAIEVTDQGRVIHLEENEEFKPYFIKIYNFAAESKYIRLSKRLVAAPDDNIDSLLLKDNTAVVPANSYLNFLLEIRPLNPGKYQYELLINEKGSAESFLLPVTFIKD